MFSGLKFIPRDQIQKVEDEDLDESKRKGKKSSNKKQKDRRKKKTTHYGSSDDDLERITKVSRKKKRWYASDEYSSYSNESGSESGSENDKKKHRNKKKERKRYTDKSDDEDINRSNKKSRRRRKDYLSGDHSSSTSEAGDSNSGRGDNCEKRSKTHGKKGGSQKEAEMTSVQDGVTDDYNIVRKEMGLEWMLKPKEIMERNSAIPNEPDETQVEIKQENPRELNPYLKNNGTGYPEMAEDGRMARGNQILSSAVVGDGGASWRLKAMKRAKEQAAREGRSFEEVVEERWGSLGQMTVSLASQKAAPSHAHLHAIKSRKKGLTEEQHEVMDDQNKEVMEKEFGRERLKEVSCHHSEMRVPKVHDSLSWGKRKRQNISPKDSGLIATAMSSLNKFADDGSFMKEYMWQQTNESGGSIGSSCNHDTESALLEREKPNDSGAIENQGLSANQLAAKAMQLRLKGKHEEGEKLLKEAENVRVKHVRMDESSRLQTEGTSRRYVRHDTSIRQKKNEDDADMHLARTIFQNKQYSMSSHVDDEYDYDDGPKRKTRRKGANDQNSTEKNTFAKRILTQQERCQFCFENPNRPRHLVVAIANFTYLSLPFWQSVVPGHCCVLTLQHESATRAVDNNVWDEIRNFKKCLIMMFAKQEKDVLFLETVMALAKQRRHCLVECIPLPRDIAKQAPLYFKKAIDEAEDEWSQHNSKKLIDTSEKGLRGSIPKDFPYFHVEFGLNRGFVHVIDDETQFKSNFGLNVIRGMLQLPEEDMHGRRKHDSVEKQKQAVASFAQDWEPFDWTKQLD